jgi:HAMP domain-containing protein
MKIIYIFLFGILALYFFWRWFLKRTIKREDFQKAENEIIGAMATKEIKEIEFLAKYFKTKLVVGWRREIKEKLLRERFNELAEKYIITKTIDTK